jgi:hypothetical protein
MRVVPLFGAGAVVLLAACGSSGADDTAEPEVSSSTGQTTVVASVPATDAVADDASDASDDASDTTDRATEEAPESVAPAPPASPVDPSQLDPGTAIVVIDGNELRFVRGDSMFDVCDLAPDFGFAAVEMDLADDSVEGGRHLVFNDDDEAQLLVVGFPPDTGFIAGTGEEIDRYLAQFDVDPPALGSADVGDGVAVGTTEMVNVFTGERVEASFTIRCE